MVKRAGYWQRTGYQAKRYFVQKALPFIGTALKNAATQYGPSMVNAAVGSGLGYAKRYSSIATQTKSKRGYKRKYSSSPAYLAGKVRAKYRARRYGRKRYLRPVVKRLFKGVSYQTEYVSTLTSDRCAYVGHSTALPDELLTMLVMACMKDTLHEAGISISSWEQSRTGYVSTGDLFQFVYKTSVNTAPTATNTSITVAVGHTTFYEIAAGLAQTLITNMKAGSLADGLILTEFQYVPTGAKLVKTDLQDVIVNFFVKSALKIQNRSVVAAGDDEMDVNNVPIYGKLYNGTGNGAIQRTVDSVQFICGPNNTLPIAVDGSSLRNFAEPPDASEFTHVRRFGKVYLNPGHIKTSVARFRSNINVTKLFQTIIQYNVSNSSSQWLNLGCFNMFALEKVIAKQGSEAGITIAYEVDYKGFMYLKPSPQRFTAPVRFVS